MNEKTKPQNGRINGRKRLLALISAFLALLTLSSCATTYTAKINGGDGSGEWLPPVSGDLGDFGSGSGEGDYSDLFGDLGDFDPSHLFSKNGFDPSVLAGLAGLAGVGDQAEKLKDFSGFTQGDAYFIADFDANPSKYSGAGRFLFAKNKVFSKEERDELMKELSADKIILASYKADSEGLPVEEYAVYPADENLAQIYISRKNPETGEKELLLYNYVSTPVNGELPVLPGEQIPDLSGLEQGERYSTRWLEWLIYEDRGSIYPMVEKGLFYTCRYDNNPKYTPSPWSIRTEGITARFALSLGLDGQEFSYADETGERFVWKVFYRDDQGDFSAAESSHPWKVKLQNSGYYRMELDLFNYGLNMMLKDNGSNNSYETVFIIEDTEGRILCWYADEVDWTDSSEAYYAQAVETGIQEDHRGQVPVIPGKEPLNVFSSDWLSWLINEDRGKTYPRVEMTPHTGSVDGVLSPSAFLIWPYDGVTGSVYKTSRFGLALALDHNVADYTEGVGKKTLPRYVWTYGYREVGQEDFLFAADMQDNCTPYGYALYGDTCIYYLDLLNYGMRPSLKEDGQPTSYEIVFVIRDRENDSNVVGWQRTVVEWNASAQAYYEKAVNKGIQTDVLKGDSSFIGQEPADVLSVQWIDWLVEYGDAKYSRTPSFVCEKRYKLTADGSPFYAVGDKMRTSYDYVLAKTADKVLKVAQFYKKKDDLSYAPLGAPMNKTPVSSSDMGISRRETMVIDYLPESLPFALGAGGVALQYEMVTVFLGLGGEVVAFAQWEFFWTKDSAAFKKEAVENGKSNEPEAYTDEWARWLLAEGAEYYPAFTSFALSEHRFEEGMNPSPFFIRKDLTSSLLVMEFSASIEGSDPISKFCLIYQDASKAKKYYNVAIPDVEVQTQDGNTVRYRLPISTTREYLKFENGKENEYNLLLIGLHSSGAILGWQATTVTWNESAESFRTLAKQTGAHLPLDGVVDLPAERYSSSWLEWTVEHGYAVESLKKLGFSPLKKEAYKDNGVLSSIYLRYNADTNAPRLLMELRHTNPMINLKEGLTEGDGSAHPYRWRLYYKEKGSLGGYAMVVLDPPVGYFDDTSNLILDLSSAAPAILYPEDGAFSGYDLVLMISDAATDAPIYGGSVEPEWNESSAAFCKEAKEQGLLG